MSRRKKGPRLYLRAGREDRRAEAVWVIRDGSTEVSTGCGGARLGAAEQALAAYIATKWSPEPEAIREAFERLVPPEPAAMKALSRGFQAIARRSCKAARPLCDSCHLRFDLPTSGPIEPDPA